MIDLDFNFKPEPKCKNCGYPQGKHKAKTMNCPFNGRQFSQFHPDKFFEEKIKKS